MRRSAPAGIHALGEFFVDRANFEGSPQPHTGVLRHQLDGVIQIRGLQH